MPNDAPMQTNVTHAALRDALTGLIDYAGLFPPAKLDMAAAVPEYLAAGGGSHAWMLGRFIVPLTRAGELLAELPAESRVAASVILDGGTGAVEDAAHLRDSAGPVSVDALEVVLEPGQIPAYAAAVDSHALDAVPSFVEFRRDGRWEQTLAEGMPALARARLGAKVRCGGLEAAAFPSPHELALFIHAAAREGVPFKATAGLHHPVRHYNRPSGFTMHGFLNVLAAARIAERGASVDEIERAIASEDARELEIGSRKLFIAYGSCSFAEPIDDLRSMGMLP